MAYQKKKTVKEVLRELYIIDNLDIFNYLVTLENPLTYHHVIKKEELKALGFPNQRNIENGLLLTRISHSYIHLIEEFAPDIFFHINKIILLITKEQRLPTAEERSLLQIMLEAFEYRMYEYYAIPKKYLTRVLSLN